LIDASLAERAFESTTCVLNINSASSFTSPSVFQFPQDAFAVVENFMALHAFREQGSGDFQVTES
jgi:hypothetical protein